MPTAREGPTPATPGRAEAGTAAVPCEAARRPPRRGPAGAGPRYQAGVTASRTRALAARRSRVLDRLAGQGLASSRAPTATISGAATMPAAWPGPGSPP